MSARVKLAGKLPGEELVDGIGAYAEALADRWENEDPNNPAALLIVGVVKVRKVEHLPSDEGRIRVPTVEVSRVETLGVLGQLPMGVLPLAPIDAQKMLLDAAEKRTGAAPLPIDAESEIDNHQVLGD